MGAMTCRLRPTAQNGNYKSATTFLKVMGDGTFNVQNNNVLQEVQKDGAAVKYMPDVGYDIKVETTAPPPRRMMCIGRNPPRLILNS